jgi:hypothetical protein
MNFLIIVEGKAERKIYKNWVPYLQPQLIYVDYLTQVTMNNYLIMSGNGYPQYFDKIDAAIEDINNYNNIDRLIISLDSEGMSYNEKIEEMNSFLEGKNCTAQIYIVIQHFCFETWALGNKRIGPRNPIKGSEVYTYKQIFNVLKNDPELLPGYPEHYLNRSQFALKYLSALARDHNTSYSKYLPTAVLNEHFFDGIKKRCQIDKEIKSFQTFIKAFS